MIYPCENGSKSNIILFFIFLCLLVAFEFVGGTERLQTNKSMKNDELSNKIDEQNVQLNKIEQHSYKKDDIL